MLPVWEQPDSLSWIGARGQTGHVIRHFRPACRAPDWRGLKNLKTPPPLSLHCVSSPPSFPLSSLSPLSRSLALSGHKMPFVVRQSVAQSPGRARRWKLHSHTLSPRDVFAIQYFHTQAASSLLWNRTLGRMRLGASGTEGLRGGGEGSAQRNPSVRRGRAYAS